jgi:hypothetical protein
VYGAGTTEANGLYVRNDSSIDGKAAYTMYAADGTTASHSMYSEVGSAWLIVEGEVDDSTTTLYSTISVSPTPPESWAVNTGEAPTPIVQALSEIDEIISYWDGARWVGSNPAEVAGYPDQNGFRLTSEPADVVYVAYKKVLPTEYGDGEQGTTEDFPAEWLNYCGYSAAREWKESVRQQDASNPVSVRSVDKKEWQVLIKANRQGAFNTIANIWSTRYAKDTSIASRGYGRNTGYRT